MKIVKKDFITLAVAISTGHILYQLVSGHNLHEAYNTIFNICFVLVFAYHILKYETLPKIVINNNYIGRPISEHNKQDISLMWDDYHGFVVGKFNFLTKEWITDAPYAFEVGGKEFEINPVLFWPLPGVPKHAKSLVGDDKYI